MKAWKKLDEERKLQHDTWCQAAGCRPGRNKDHHPRGAKQALLAVPLFDHEPGCSSSSMWKYLVCCRRECLGKEIGRPAFLQPHSPILPTFPGAPPALSRVFWGSALISLSFAQITWEANAVLISALWFKIRWRGGHWLDVKTALWGWKLLSLVFPISASSV